MSKTPPALVKPELLRWARERRRLSLEDAAKKIDQPVERLAGWEGGEGRPSIAQLRTIANVYRRPLAVFFLPRPPTDFDAMSLPDFRRVPGAKPKGMTPELALEVRSAAAVRDEATELANQLNDLPDTLGDIAALDDDPEELAVQVRDRLGVSLADQRSWREARLAYNAWRRALERFAILTFQFSGVESDEARGFSITGPGYSVVAVNSRDTYTGRSFSLMHELAHVLLNHGGVCDLAVDQGEETFCNMFAAELLVPRAALVARSDVKQHAVGAWEDEEIRRLARDFGVSDEVVLRRLLAVGKTTEKFYELKRGEFLRRADVVSVKEESGGGPSMPVRVVSKLGIAFVRLVLAAHQQGKITFSEVSDLLGAKVKHVPEIEAWAARA